MFCTNCGNEQVKHNQYCAKCGARVQGHSEAELEILLKPVQKVRKNYKGWYIGIASILVIAGLSVVLLLTQGSTPVEGQESDATWQADIEAPEGSDDVQLTDIALDKPGDEETEEGVLEETIVLEEQTPVINDDEAVALAMELYQTHWSSAMSAADMSILTPYVVVDSQSPNAVYKVTNIQVQSLSQLKKDGTEMEYATPVYETLDSQKISDTHYQLQISKRVKRTVQKGGKTTSTTFKETAYTYNLIKEDDNWLVDSTVESSVPETCYTDETYTVKAVCR